MASCLDESDCSGRQRGPLSITLFQTHHRDVFADAIERTAVHYLVGCRHSCVRAGFVLKPTSANWVTLVSNG
jgi:hypothetical protein